MNTIFERIIEDARQQGACTKALGVTDLKKACEVFFTPQGREFCIKHRFPMLTDFRLLRTLGASRHNVWIDYGSMDIVVEGDCALIGATNATIHISGTEKPHAIILMHGAQVTIHASNYAVVTVENTSECSYEFVNDDNTAIIL